MSAPAMTITEQRAAVAYLRRSSATTKNPGNDSREMQESAVKGLCGEAVTLYVDWGKSGGGSGAKRPEYQRLKADIAAGLVGSVCAYHLTRLGRSALEILQFVELCRDNDVTVRTATDHIDTSGPYGRFTLTILAGVAELEREMGKERTASAFVAKTERHAAAGLDVPSQRAMYGTHNVKSDDGIWRNVPDPERPIGPVLDAYREAGSIRGACQLLNERGVILPRGNGTVWGVTTLRRVLDRYASLGMVELPEIKHVNDKDIRRPVRGNALFAGLLRCHCGRTMTPNVKRKRGRPQYYCAGGRDSGAALHGQLTVMEHALRPVLEAEAAKYQRRSKIGHRAAMADQRELDKLTAQRGVIEDNLIDGTIPPVKGKAAIARIDAKLSELESQTKRGLLLWQEAIPEWDDVPAMNRHLRRLWTIVKLDADMVPTVEWGIPGSLYGEDGES